MITINCHCGNISLSFKKPPKYLRDCDCPMCNRLGALWGDFSLAEVTVESKQATNSYLWGDGDFEMHHCSQCGCSTHYTPTDPSATLGIGVNMRMLDRRQLELIPIQS